MFIFSQFVFLFFIPKTAMYMDGQLILRKARGLLYQFRQLPKIPCTLSNLCRRCGPGIDSHLVLHLYHPSHYWKIRVEKSHF